ncbi:hypothetical protein TI04_13785, partial [Achromatium sp. WMS2]
LGATAEAIQWPGSWNNANLLPPNLRRQVTNLSLLINVTLGILVLAMLIAVSISPILQKRAILIGLKHQLNQIRPQVKKVNDLRKLIEQESQSNKLLVETRTTAPYLVSLLSKLTELVPHSAWIDRFDYSNGYANFSGEAQQATALIEQLIKDPVFHNSTFRSPVVSIPNSDKERFNIQVQYEFPGAT